MELHLNWVDCLTFYDGDVYTWKKVRIPQNPPSEARQIVLPFSINVMASHLIVL